MTNTHKTKYKSVWNINRGEFFTSFHLHTHPVRVTNEAFASAQAIRVEGNAVLRPTEHGSERAGRKNALCADSLQAAGYRTCWMNQNNHAQRKGK